MNILASLFLIALCSGAVFSAPTKDGAVPSADAKEESEKPLEKNTDLKQEKAVEETDSKTALETSVKAEDKVDLKKEDKSEMKVLEAKEKSSSTDNTKIVEKEEKSDVKKLDVKDKVINSEDLAAISKKDLKKEDNTEMKSLDSKTETESSLKKAEKSDMAQSETKEMAMNTVDVSVNEKSVPKSNEKVKTSENAMENAAPAHDIKINEFDPKLLEAVPEIRTLTEVKSELKESLEKLKKISKMKKPVPQEDDQGKAEIAVTTSSSNESRPTTIIKNFATAAGNFISSLIQLPITFLTSIQQIILDLGISKPSHSQSPQIGFSALLGTGTTAAPYR